ncbi:hypothetical protein ES708_24652 [subsurface metagenome]
MPLLWTSQKAKGELERTPGVVAVSQVIRSRRQSRTEFSRE